jgi:hypothetical protein
MRIVIQPIEANEAPFASMRIIGKLSSIATNDQGPWINTRPLSAYDSKRLYNADEAMKGSFRPKDKFSERAIAKYTSILQENNCLVIVYTLVNDSQDFPEPDANRMRFIAPREEGSPVD